MKWANDDLAMDSLTVLMAAATPLADTPTSPGLSLYR
jgi:hypothetical protein